MATDSGFSNQKKKGTAQFETVHGLGSSSFGKVSANKSLYEITAATAISSVTDIIGSNGQVQYWNIEFTSHGAIVGNVARFLMWELTNFEFEIVEVVDADNFYILPISDIKPTTENCTIMGWVTNKVGSDGSISVTASVTAPVVNPLAKARLDFSVTNVTTGAWVQLISSVGATLVKKMQVFMSQGNALELAFGAAASEVSKIYIFPGGNEVFDIDIPANTRLSLRAVSSTANTGEILVNLLG